MHATTQVVVPSAAAAPPAPSAAERVRVGFPMRFVAAAIDVLIAGAAAAMVGILVSLAAGGTAGTIAQAAVVLAYFSFEVVKAQSVGKMIFGYTITAQDGSPATPDKLIRRYLYKMAPTVIGILAVIPFVGILFSILAGLAGLAVVIGTVLAAQPETLALHDKLFGTAVYGPSTVSLSIPGLGLGGPNASPPPQPATASQPRPAQGPTA